MMYKTKLQEMCQQKLWALPKYSTMKDGPEHDPRFKASVIVNGVWFHSSTSCKSCKEAQNDAAKSAFLHFTSSSASPADATLDHVDIELSIYKNLLQELTQRKRFDAPVYKTAKIGVPHSPTFYSSVQVGGEAFHGKGAKSKKEAEMNAAKDAYNNLTQRLHGKGSGDCSSEFMAEEHAEENDVQVLKAEEKVLSNFETTLNNSSSCSKSVPVSSKEGLEGKSYEFYSPDFVANSTFATAVEHEEHAEESKSEVMAVEKELANVRNSPDKSSSCSKSVPVLPKEGSSSSASTHLDISALSISDSNRKKGSRPRSYVLNNRFRVYSYFPDDITFPKGITVLPVREDKWVAVSLEFPNEKDV